MAGGKSSRGRPAGPGLFAAAAPPLRLFDLTTAHGVVDERPFRPTHVFAPDDEVIYLWYAAEGCGIGTKIRSTWWYLDTDPPSRLTDGTVTVDRAGNWGQFNFVLAPGGRWAIGRYRIELHADDELMAETEFIVARGAQLADAAGPGSRGRQSAAQVARPDYRKSGSSRGLQVADIAGRSFHRVYWRLLW